MEDLSSDDGIQLFARGVTVSPTFFEPPRLPRARPDSALALAKPEDLAQVAVSFDGLGFAGLLSLPYLDKKAYKLVDPALRSCSKNRLQASDLAQKQKELITKVIPSPPPPSLRLTRKEKLQAAFDRRKRRAPRLRGRVYKGYLWSERRERREAQKKEKKKSQNRGTKGPRNFGNNKRGGGLKK